MDAITVEAYVQLIERQGEVLAVAADAAGLDAPVPTCPGWAVRDLLGHTGMVHRWAAAYVRERLPDRRQPTRIEKVTGARAVDDYRAANAELVGELRTAPADLECFTLWPDSSPLRFWARRQAHETAVHALDAAIAAGTEPPRLDADVAADGLDELLVDMRGGRLRRSPAVTVRFTATDIDRAWELRVSGETTDVAVGPAAEVDATGRQARPELQVVGSATAVHRWAWNRSDATGDVREIGDPALVDWWRGTARIGR